MSRERPKLAFYSRLTRTQQREYDRSDRLGELPLKPARELGRAAEQLVAALATGDVRATRKSAQMLADEICSRIRRKGVPPRPAPRIRVLKARPRLSGGEYHGLYTLAEDGRCEIRIWMLTAANRQVVRPRTFIRTLLHELVHHIDMTLLDLPSSFHTIGFHARESSMLRAIEASGAVIPGGRRKGKREQSGAKVARSGDGTVDVAPMKTPATRSAPDTPAGRARPGQLDLFRF